jgi:16S rRNA (guanine966-N2)-methyltransferase
MIRITGGEFKGRGLAVPAQDSTRPTQAKLRQALFNSIQFRIPEARVLDLFAGSGALALEALSRGARHAVMVENHRGALQCIQKNIRDLEVGPRTRVIAEDAAKGWRLAASMGPFDFVFADPPYAADWEMRLLDEAPWRELLAEDGVLLVEWGVKKSKIEELPDETEHLVKIREKVYGDSVLTSYRRKGPPAEEKGPEA